MVAISVDSVARNAALADKLLLPFPLLADETAAASLGWGIYDPTAQIARPALFVVGADLSIPLRYLGRDYADRPSFAAIFAALDEVRGREPQRLATSVPFPGPREPRDGGRRALPLAELSPYLRGANFGVAALSGRFADPELKAEAKRYQDMIAEFMRHVAATERLVAERRAEPPAG